MANHVQTTSAHLVDEEESYFISMTDMMVGVLFIFIILLMAFALNFQVATIDRERLVREIDSTHEVREAILESIRRTLEDEGVYVSVDLDSGVLRLPERILFGSGQDFLSPEGVVALQALAGALAKVVPCYANPSSRRADSACRQDDSVYLESIAVEGHTDNVPVGPGRPFSDNWELSMLRAINTYKELIARKLELNELANPDGQNLFSVSGYGEFRPIDNNDTEQGRQANRRIDLRFRMMPPNRHQAAKHMATDTFGGN